MSSRPFTFARGGAAAHRSTRPLLIGAAAVLAAGLAAQASVLQVGATVAPNPAAPSVYTALQAPVRLQTETPLNAGNHDTINVVVADGSTIPSNATAAVLVVTQTSNVSSDFVQVYPSGGSTSTSVLNTYFANQLTSNLVTTQLGEGSITVHSNRDAHVIVDAEGYYAPAPDPGNSTAGTYNPVTPARLADTRAGSGQPSAGHILGAGKTMFVLVAGAGGVPATGGVTAAVVNLTAVNDSKPGFLQTYPDPAAQPLHPQTSNLNYNGAGQIVATRDVVAVNGESGGFTIYSNAATDVVVDVVGWFNGETATPGSYFFPTSATRVYDSRSHTPIAGGATLTLPVAGASGIYANATAAALNLTIDKTTTPSTRPNDGFLTAYNGGNRPLASDINFPATSIVPNALYATLAGDGSISIFNHSASAVDVILDSFGYFGPSPLPSLVSAAISSGPAKTITATYSQPVTCVNSGDLTEFSLGGHHPTSYTCNGSTTVTLVFASAQSAGTLAYANAGAPLMAISSGFFATDPDSTPAS